MKQAFRLLLFLALVGGSLWAQQVYTTTITGTGCQSIDVTGKGVVGISVSNNGTAWSGTIQPEIAIGGDAPQNAQVTPYNSSSAQATITANGTYQAFVTGATTFLLCGNTVTNVAGVKWMAANLAARSGGGSGGGLPAGLSFAAPTLTVSTAGSGNGTLALSGTTSGTATFTAPAVAGTNTNPVISSNVLQLPAGTAANTALNFGTANTGIFSAGATDFEVAIGGSVKFQLFSTTLYNPGITCGESSQLSCMTNTASLWSLTGSSAPNFGFGQTKGQHFVTQAANNDTSGICALAAATTCTVTFTTAYTATPVCVITPEFVAATATVSISAKSTTAFTITASASTTGNVDYLCMGSPN